MHLSRVCSFRQGRHLLRVEKDGSFFSGDGGRGSMNKRLPGMTYSSLKANYPLMPLFLCVGVGCIMAVGANALKSPDVTWTKSPEPYNSYRYKQYKLLNPSGIDHVKQGESVTRATPNYTVKED